MKTSIKIAALLVAIMCNTLALKAQTTKTTASNGIIYSVGVESGSSLGSTKDLHKWSLGGSILQYEGSTKFNDFKNSKENMMGVHLAYAFSIK